MKPAAAIVRQYGDQFHMRPRRRRLAVGMYQMTDAALSETQGYCVLHHTVVETGCSATLLHSRVVPPPTLPLPRRVRAPRARVGSENQRPWPADKVERWAIDRLIPYAKNARTHTDAQVAAIAASIKEWGWTTPALVGEDGGLIAGHARVLAARQLGIVEVPVMVAAGWRRKNGPTCWPTTSWQLPGAGGTRSFCASNSAS